MAKSAKEKTECIVNKIEYGCHENADHDWLTD